MTTPSDPVPDKTILLIGLMGAGKSAIGRRLARALDRPFVDSDKEVEAAAGCSIPEIFERYGEAAFRDCELRVMARLLNGPPCVLATGGGAFLDPQTRALVRDMPTSMCSSNGCRGARTVRSWRAATSARSSSASWRNVRRFMRRPTSRWRAWTVRTKPLSSG